MFSEKETTYLQSQRLARLATVAPGARAVSVFMAPRRLSSATAIWAPVIICGSRRRFRGAGGGGLVSAQDSPCSPGVAPVTQYRWSWCR